MEDNRYFVDMYGEMPCTECGEMFVPRATTDGEALDLRCSRCEASDTSISEHLREFVELFLERKMREADVSDGSRVPHGSSKHIKDLEVRIADLSRWRDKQRRGSEAKANYSRLISRLKGELSSAKRQAAKARSK